MLVLTRRTDQIILIGDPASGEAPIEITVVEVKGGPDRLGIKAPRTTAVHRKEIYEQIQEENKAAAQAGTASVPILPLKR